MRARAVDVPTDGPPGRRPAPPVRRGRRTTRADGVGRGEHHPLVGSGRPPGPAAAARAAPPSAGSSMAMTGSSTTDAPRPVSRPTSSDAWARARVTTTRRPASDPGSGRQRRPRPGRAGGAVPVVTCPLVVPRPGHRLRSPRAAARSRPSRPARPPAPTTMAAGAGEVDVGQAGQGRCAPPAGGRWCPSGRRPPGWSRPGRRPAARSVMAARAAHAHEDDEGAVEPAEQRPSRRRAPTGRRRGRSPR